MKKIMAVIMVVAMLLPFGSVAFAAETNEGDLPLIYLSGQHNSTVYNSEGQPIKDAKAIDRGAYIKECAGPVLEKLGEALLTGNYTPYVDAIVDACVPIYEEQILTPDGVVQEGQHILWDCETAKIEKRSTYGIPAYNFYYDSRLSPLDVADQLDIYVERVLEATGAKKVNISGRCMGANFVMAYVAKSYRGDYDHPFRVQNIVHNTSAVDGYIAIGALLSGSIDLSADAIDRFATYYLEGGELIDDPAIEMLAMSLVSILNYAEVLGWGTEVIEEIYANVADQLIPRLALISNYGRNPCYWAMVGSDYLEKAVDFVFNTPELKEEYAGLISKIEEYYELIGAINEETGNNRYVDLLIELDEQSINSCVLAKYGEVTFPLFEGSEITGDARGTVTELSYGATATRVDERFSDEYLAQAEQKGTLRYISPDRTVDASTCLFPDQTWFAANIAHGDFPQQQNELMQAFFRSNGELTVWDTADYMPQYTEYSTGKLLPAEDNIFNSSWDSNPFVHLIRIITSLLKIITSLLEGTMELGGILAK